MFQVFLFLGMMGHAVLYGSAFETLPKYMTIGLVVAVAFPYILVFGINFTKVSILPPRPYRHCMVFSMFWYAMLTLLAEVMLFLGCMPPNDDQHAIYMGRIFMHLGWLSFRQILNLNSEAKKAEDAFASEVENAQ